MREFVVENDLQLSDNYPVKTTDMCDGTGASSQIDYWVLGEMNFETVTISSPNTLNLSDHVETVSGYRLI